MKREETNIKVEKYFDFSKWTKKMSKKIFSGYFMKKGILLTII
jgi:hypothetical protein